MFVLIIIVGGLKVLENRKYARIHDADEIAWIFTGYYFNLYFLRFDLFHPDWNDYEAFDHPPLAKYIVGGSLFLKGYTIDSLDPKKFWNNIPITEFPRYFDLVKDKIPNPAVVIPSARSVMFIFALSSLLLIYFFVRNSYGVPPAFVSTSLIISSPIYNRVSIWILAEPILLFFYALFILLCGLYLKSRKHIFIVFAFIVSSLAFLTKLNGILLVFVLMIIFLIKNKFSITKQDWKFVITGFIAFLLMTVLLNPVFLNTGIRAMEKMVEVRFSAFRVYQETFKDVALLSISERFITATRMIFFSYSLFYNVIKVPVELIMFVVGVYYIFRRRDLLLIAIIAFLVVIPISILPHNTPRYYYWIFPFTHIIAGVSLNLFKELLLRKDVGLLKVQDKFLNLSRFI
jgi:4-amino-4-deoxy-L-arabinose transferase-like glycosyltransferase